MATFGGQLERLALDEDQITGIFAELDPVVVDEACERYSLSLEEFTSWQRAVDRSGMPGLRVTRIKHYRDVYER
jgi:hypothetical protein